MWACWLNTSVQHKHMLVKHMCATQTEICKSISTKSLFASVSQWFLFSGAQLEQPNHYHQFSKTITNVSNGRCQMSPSFHWSLLPAPNFFCSTDNSRPPIVTNVNKFTIKKILQLLLMFVWSAVQHILNLNLTIKVCTRWMRALWQVCEDCTIVIYAIPHKNLVCGLHSRWASWFIT